MNGIGGGTNPNGGGGGCCICEFCGGIKGGAIGMGMGILFSGAIFWFKGVLELLLTVLAGPLLLFITPLPLFCIFITLVTAL